MIRNRHIVAAGVASILLCFFVFYLFWRAVPAHRQPPREVMEAKVVHGWLQTWANEHDGKFPDKVDDLLTIDVGADPAYFRAITEYRGTGKSVSDMPSDALLLRYRAGKKGDLEGRVSFAGSSMAKRPEEWASTDGMQ